MEQQGDHDDEQQATHEEDAIERDSVLAASHACTPPPLHACPSIRVTALLRICLHRPPPSAAAAAISAAVGVRARQELELAATDEREQLQTADATHPSCARRHERLRSHLVRLWRDFCRRTDGSDELSRLRLKKRSRCCMLLIDVLMTAVWSRGSCNAQYVFTFDLRQTKLSDHSWTHIGLEPLLQSSSSHNTCADHGSAHVNQDAAPSARRLRMTIHCHERVCRWYGVTGRRADVLTCSHVTVHLLAQEAISSVPRYALLSSQMQRRVSKRRRRAAGAVDVDDETSVAVASSAPAQSSPSKRACRRSIPAAAAVAPADDEQDTARTLLVADGRSVQVAPMEEHAASCSGPFSASSVSAWRHALARDGYLYLSDLLPRETVLDARATVLQHLRARGLVHPAPADTSSEEERLQAKAIDPDAPTNLLSQSSLHHHPTVLAALEHPRLFDLFAELLDPPLPTGAQDDGVLTAAAALSVTAGTRACVWTSEYKWLRGVPRHQCTGFHLDSVYMKGSLPLYSLWLPLGDLSEQHGNLVVCPGSHRSAQFARLRAEYGQSDAGVGGNGTTSGWIKVEDYTDEPVQYVSSPARAGSVVVLDLRVLHCTSQNVSDEYRLSCDTRWAVTQARKSTPDESSDSHAEAGDDNEAPPQASIRFRRQRHEAGKSEDDGTA